jgi:hypothetical protein
LTHDNSIFQFPCSRLVISFISSMRWPWFMVFFIESIEFLLSVKMVAVRGVSSVISISPIASRALVIASCSAWLFEHLLSSLNFSCSARSVPMYSATPDPTPRRVLLPSV